jgi:molybdopterin-guanine dinucleotide biosynthesis adapter protein
VQAGDHSPACALDTTKLYNSIVYAIIIPAIKNIQICIVDKGSKNMAIPVVSFVGCSDSGKTTLLERLIPELKRRGHRVATIKHAEEIDFEPGKDSGRHLRAGSDLAVVVAPHQMVMVKSTGQPAAIEDVISLIGNDYDIILAEGYKNASVPKIVLCRGNSEPLLASVSGLVGAVTDKPLDIDVRQFSFADIFGIADYIEENFIRPETNTIDIYVNGVPIPLTKFPCQIFSQNLISMVSCLKGVGEFEKIEILLRKRTVVDENFQTQSSEYFNFVDHDVNTCSSKQQPV